MNKRNYVVSGSIENKDFDIIEKKINSFYKDIESALVTKNGGDYDPDIRKGNVAFLQPQKHSRIFKIVQKYFLQYYSQIYTKFNFDTLPEIQFASYDSGDFFKKHQDTIASEDYLRCLTMSINLSSPDSYKEGNLKVFLDDSEELFLEREKGSFIIFPSFYLHEAEKVLQGKRKSLVCWYHDTFTNFEKFKQKVEE